VRAACPHLLAALLALGGCGRINYDPVPLPVEVPAMDAPAVAEPDGDVRPPPSPDAATPAEDAAPVVCTNGAFSAPVLVQIDGLDPNLPDLYGPRLGPDGNTLWLSQTKGTPFKDEDIWTVQRVVGTAAHFDRPARVDALVSAAFDGSTFASADGQEVLFSSARVGGTGNRDLWISRRDSMTTGWAAPAALAELNSANDEQNPSLSGDGLVLFFSSDREGTKGREDIYTSFRAGRMARFSNPVRMAELSSGNKDGAPFVTADSLTIYFTSNRAGGRGGIDLWTARRSSRVVPFSPPSPLANVNSTFHDDDPAISADGRELYFSSNRDGKNFRIYRATRCP
jgi:Tol biopolymer transport system component